jgi:hypothetical protein
LPVKHAPVGDNNDRIKDGQVAGVPV